MITTPTNEFGRFLWTVIMLTAVAVMGLWWVRAPIRQLPVMPVPAVAAPSPAVEAAPPPPASDAAQAAPAAGSSPAPDAETATTDGRLWFNPKDFLGDAETKSSVADKPAVIVAEVKPTAAEAELPFGALAPSPAPAIEPPASMPMQAESAPLPQTPLTDTASAAPAPAPAVAESAADSPPAAGSKQSISIPVNHESLRSQAAGLPIQPGALLTPPPQRRPTAVSLAQAPSGSSWKPSIKVRRIDSITTRSQETVLPGTMARDTQTTHAPELDAFDLKIQRSLQQIWMPPLPNEVPQGADRFTMRLTITRDGSVLKSDEDRPSGNVVMDRSVRYAAALFINAGQTVPDVHQPAEYEAMVEFRLR